MAPRTRLRPSVDAIICGLPLAVMMGLVENRPDASIIEAKYYGYPLVWRTTMTFQPTEYNFVNLALDMGFWIIISFLVLVLIEKIVYRRTR